MSSPRIVKLTFARNASPIGIGQARPALAWRFEQDKGTAEGWTQKSYELSFSRNGDKAKVYKVPSSDNFNVEWPKDEPSLKSRDRVEVKVRAEGGSGWTEWYTETVEAALLESSDWTASVVAPDTPGPANIAKRPFHLRKTFKVDKSGLSRVYATALGVYELKINGKQIGDHVMAPGWQSYNHRLHYQTYEVPEGVLSQGENTIEAVIGEGWYSGRLTWMEQCRNLWGTEIGLQMQLEVDGKPVVTTSDDWEWSFGPLIDSQLYDGEVYDASITSKEWKPTKTISLPSSTTLIAPEAPPIRRTQELKPKKLITTASGKKIIDFGQNLVGWVKLKNIPKKSGRTDCIVMRFAEVLEKSGEMGMRPLRSAKCTDKIYLGEEGIAEWEPKFTTHGFRFCEITGAALLLQEYEENITAVVVHSDMERLGDFECSHPLVTKLHQNVVWGLRGNFVGLPTDCPQRDERLGWTGDLQAFAPTASYLYDTSGFLANWLHDLSEEQIKDCNGVVPLVVPNTLVDFEGGNPPSHAVWGDVCVITPKDLYHAYGSAEILTEMWESITTWFDKGIKRGANGLWDNPRNGFQLSDWLDPGAPPDDPGAAMTDQFLVADAYLVGVANTVAEIAKILGKTDEHKKYSDEHAKLRKTFQHEYMTPSGRLSSDTQTAYCLAFLFNLLDKDQIAGASERLIRLARKSDFKIATGFAGTPGILHALTQAGHLQVAYRMLQEKGCPSWLYPVSMDATTIWERWDSLLPNGEINPGEMTSFNHYALGAVANFLHTTVGGLKPLEPGYRRLEIRPQPGGTVTTASTHTITPSGLASVSWTLKEGQLEVDFVVPANTQAVVVLGGKEETVGSGTYNRKVKYEAEGEWPPAPYQTQFAQPKTSDTLAL